MDEKDMVRNWLAKDPKLCYHLKGISNALLQSKNQYVDDHRHGVGVLKTLKSIVIVQKQELTMNVKTRELVWSNICRDNKEFYTHDYAWCCPFPTYCKNPLYVTDGTVHLTTMSSGMDFRNDKFEDIQYIPLHFLNRDFTNLCESNVLFSVEEFHDLMQSIPMPPESQLEEDI